MNENDELSAMNPVEIRILTGVVLLAAFLLSLHFFASPLRPWPDQGWILEAAIRHSRGLGLTTMMNSGSMDLANPEYARMIYFPPLYSYVVSGLLSLGFGVDLAVKLLNGLAMIAGIFAWMKLAARILSGTWLRLFAVLLVVTGSATVPKGGTVDYVYWAIVPCWFLGLLIASERMSDDRRAPWRILLFSSLLAAVAIGFRWAAVALVPTGMAVLVLPAVLARWSDIGVRVGILGSAWARVVSAKTEVIAAIVYAVPPTAFYFVITMTNRVLAPEGSALGFMRPGWRWGKLLVTYPVEALFTIPLAIQPVLDRVWRALDTGMSSGLGEGLFRVIIPLVIGGAMLGMGLHYRRLVFSPRSAADPNPARDRFAKRTELEKSDHAVDREIDPPRGEDRFELATLVVIGSWIAFLAFMAVRYSWPDANWSFLDEPRYVRPILPLLTLAWLAWMARSSLGSRPRATIVFVMLVCSLYSLQAMARWEIRRMTTVDESWELVESVLSIEREPGAHVVVDNEVSDYVIRAGSRLVAAAYPVPERASEVTFSGSPSIWFVRRLHEVAPYVRDPDFNRKRFDALVSRFDVEKVWTSSEGSYEIYRTTPNGFGASTTEHGP